MPNQTSTRLAPRKKTAIHILRRFPAPMLFHRLAVRSTRNTRLKQSKGVRTPTKAKEDFSTHFHPIETDSHLRNPTENAESPSKTKISRKKSPFPSPTGIRNPCDCRSVPTFGSHTTKKQQSTAICSPAAKPTAWKNQRNPCNPSIHSKLHKPQIKSRKSSPATASHDVC